MDVNEHAKSIATRLCDNKWWDEMSELDEKAKFSESTEREVFSKRLQYWVTKMEGDMATEAPMYTFNLSKKVMEIFDLAAKKTTTCPPCINSNVCQSMDECMYKSKQ